MTLEPRDEVSFSDYQEACRALSRNANQLEGARPDEAAEHYLPEITRHIAIIFSFVGSNMTARHVPKYVRAQAALDRAKDGVVESPTTPPTEED